MPDPSSSPPSPDRLAALEGLFRALADRTRLRILALLARGEICVCDIHGKLRDSAADGITAPGLPAARRPRRDTQARPVGALQACSIQRSDAPGTGDRRFLWVLMPPPRQAATLGDSGAAPAGGVDRRSAGVLPAGIVRVTQWPATESGGRVTRARRADHPPEPLQRLSGRDTRPRRSVRWRPRRPAGPAAGCGLRAARRPRRPPAPPAP